MSKPELFEEKTALTVPENGPAVQITPANMLALAASQNVDPDKLQKLMDFAERWQANQARMAYNAAMMAFKEDAIRITRNITYSDGPLKGKSYADLFGVVDKLTPALSSHGLSASWRVTKDDPAWLEVTCTIRHEGGHSESVSMGGEPDKGPARNTIQARGSAITYLERYTLLAATGMAVSGQDDDGGRAVNQGECLPETVVTEFVDALKEAPDLHSLKSLFSECWNKAKKLGDGSAKQQFQSAYEAAKKRFQA